MNNSERSWRDAPLPYQDQQGPHTEKVNNFSLPCGSLLVSSSPSGAHVYGDGFYRGITPINITDVNLRSYTVRVTKSGYNTFTTAITLSAGNSTQVTANLILLSEVKKNPTAVENNSTTSEKNSTETINPPDTSTLTPTLPLTPPNTFNPRVIVGIILLVCIGGVGYYLFHSRKP